MTRPVTPAERSAALAGKDSAASVEPVSSDSDSVRRAAHRLPTGAYPVVATEPADRPRTEPAAESASMRPRNEPPPEPADLFRPPARRESDAEGPHPLAPDAAVTVGSGRPPGDASVLGPGTQLTKKPDGRTG